MKLFSFAAICFFGVLAVVSATADPVAASSNGPLREQLAEILSRVNAIPGTEEGAALSTTSKPVANQGSFYIGECINCNKPKTANEVAKALIKVKAALEAAQLLLQKFDPKEVYLGTWRNYAIIARPMF
ncbi:hypothetical protein ACLKA6_014676 [Drosophila palustris]